MLSTWLHSATAACFSTRNCVKMDIENGNFSNSATMDTLIFTGIRFEPPKTVLDQLRQRLQNDEKVGGNQVILKDACGALRPGRLTFILGPSGAGKTTLMKIIAGRKKIGVSGCLLGTGKQGVLVAQQATLIETLTGRETLQFAATLKLPELHQRDRDYTIANVSKQLGIQEALNTRVSFMSGGERKRLNIACELLTDPTVMLLDEPTRSDSEGEFSTSAITKTVLPLPSDKKKAIKRKTIKTTDRSDSDGEDCSAAKTKIVAPAARADKTKTVKQATARTTTSGLDSVSSMSVVRALLSVARGGRTVACVVHQPASKLYASADDVILLADGRTLYAGSVEDAPDAFRRAGFICPQYYNMADYLLEVASGEHAGNLNLLEKEAKSYAYEMKKIARSNVVDNNGKVPVPEAEALLQTSNVQMTDKYAASFCQQLRALLWRCSIGALRDVHLTQMRLACHILVALLLGALYCGAGGDAARVTTNSACLFFFLLFLFFSNAMPTIHTFPVEASVVLQEHLNKWYSLTSYCISKLLADLPIQILCATVFVIPAWALTSQPMEPYRIIMIWIICVLITILAQTFGLVIGAACGVKLGLFVVPAANIPMLMFSEFFIPYHEMPVYLRPFAAISYFRYAFDACLQTVYGFDRPRLPCNQAFCMFRDPKKYLSYIGLSMKFQNDVYALLAWIIFLQISLLAILSFKMYRACR